MATPSIPQMHTVASWLIWTRQFCSVLGGWFYRPVVSLARTGSYLCSPPLRWTAETRAAYKWELRDNPCRNHPATLSDMSSEIVWVDEWAMCVCVSSVCSLWVGDAVGRKNNKTTESHEKQGQNRHSSKLKFQHIFSTSTVLIPWYSSKASRYHISHQSTIVKISAAKFIYIFVSKPVFVFLCVILLYMTFQIKEEQVIYCK